MNDRFFDLPEEKRGRILDEALKVFGERGYKGALTDDIAARAGISKGLLFYYFENKRGLYEYLFRYSLEYLTRRLNERYAWEGDDLFEIVRRSSRLKVELMKEKPPLFQFLMYAYYRGEGDHTEVLRLYNAAVERSKRAILERMNRDMLRPGVDPEILLELVLGCAEGFLLQAQRSGELYGDLNRLCDRLDVQMELLKRAFCRDLGEA